MPIISILFRLNQSWSSHKTLPTYASNINMRQEAIMDFISRLMLCMIKGVWGDDLLFKCLLITQKTSLSKIVEQQQYTLKTCVCLWSVKRKTKLQIRLIEKIENQ